MLFTRDGHNVFLGDMFRGHSAFLMCAGPSLISHDLAKLQQRGILTCAVNNAAAVVRPNLWVSVDDPGNFCDAIWRDPAILKFVPLCHMEKHFTVRNEAGELVPSPDLVGDMPAVFGYRRNEAFVAEQWLHEDTFNWGNHSERVDALGIRGSRSVMLIALRMLFFLGVRRVYLLGCDFRMTFGGQNYAFDQDRTQSSVSGNNSSYVALNTRFMALKKAFDQEDFQVFNCTPDSGLQVFPHCDFEQAVRASLADFPSEIRTAGMYERKAKTRAKLKRHIAVDSSNVQNVKWNACPADPVDALNLPSLTLVTAVDRENLETFRYTWGTWMHYRGWLRRMPVLIIYNRRQNIIKTLRRIVQGHEQVRFLGGVPSEEQLGNDRWASLYVQIPAKHVRTPWYLKLEPEAIACRSEQWLNPEWFHADNSGLPPAFIADACEAKQTNDVLVRLNAWGDRTAGLAIHSPLRTSAEFTDSPELNPGIASWFFLGNTAWTQEVAQMAPGGLPCTDHDTFMWYSASRAKRRLIRYPIQQACGWEHSFSSPGTVAERCRTILNQSAKEASVWDGSQDADANGNSIEVPNEEWGAGEGQL